jgi:signal transduction histidine kinase
MHSNGMRLLKLINDLLELVRLESGHMEVKREPLPVEEFIKGLLSAARQVADDKRLKFDAHVSPDIGCLLADRDKLEKILLNLIFNALKFTPAGGLVQVRAEKRGSELVLLVSDTGMGISQKNLPFIFDRFWQADGSSKRKFQGVGIGLAMVKELTEIMGGKVSVASAEGKGTTFEVTFPFQAAELPTPEQIPERDGAPTAAVDATVSSEEWLANLYRRAELFPALTSVQDSIRPVENPKGGQMPTVLIADDEPDMLRFLKSQLSATCRILEAVDGQQAIEKAAQFLPDLILLDMMMPEKDGLQTCTEIRERTATRSIPVIMLTARADEETKMSALSAGANDFLPKPFSTTELHVRIRNLLESHNYQRRLTRQNHELESTIEQLKETETQLVQNEKLASLGRMSAGIIHEINNPLNFASTGLFALRNKCKNLDPDRKQSFEEILADVEDGLRRVKTIVTDLRTFTRLDKDSLEQVDVAEAVAAALRLVSSEIKSRNTCVTQSLAPGQTVWANKNKLIQVMVNLLQNSIDAMETKVYDNGGPTIHILGLCDSDRSIVRVRDNGPGIDLTHRDKIFEPFFTTKDIGKGLGLGLSICYRLVQEFDGRISVRTEPGMFCEFSLEFPAKG